MLRPREVEWPKRKRYYANNPSYDKNFAWLKRYLLGSSGDMYFFSGEVEYQVYSKLAEEFHETSLNI